ncbi:MAG: coproporphyrinogen oxidase [Frankiales bacterium]|jgi:putative oxygen-independent coproporphyrinogen III oxidase|nr:coproporphyrinogen oxidase [Frankiales bacterium]
MPSALPDGEPVPASGALPEAALAELGSRPFGMYVHVPFCVTRCGYCDFNTYTDLGGLQGTYAQTAVEEVRLARRVLGDRAPVVDTVFVGGGTPTLLPPSDLALVLQAVRTEFGLAADAEVTTEANPDSVDQRSLEQLREAGFTRISFGMQSAVPHVLQVLDRTHTPGRPEQAVAEAYGAGFEQVSLDLIYGAPGESDVDWKTSLDVALQAGPTHVSAYALIVEGGTRLGRQVARGELPAPDDDALADRYLMAEEALADLGWYEVSNWGEPCRHNLGYWRGADWWGIGPGSHSHVGGVRWWNVKHPAAYAARLGGQESPGAGRELLSVEDRRVERVLLEVRLRDGLDLGVLRPAGRAAAERFAREGLLELAADRAVLTLRGRLLADAVVRELVD